MSNLLDTTKTLLDAARLEFNTTEGEAALRNEVILEQAQQAIAQAEAKEAELSRLLKETEELLQFLHDNAVFPTKFINRTKFGEGPFDQIVRIQRRLKEQRKTLKKL